MTEIALERTIDKPPISARSTARAVRELPLRSHIRIQSLLADRIEDEAPEVSRRPRDLLVSLGVAGISLYLMSKGMHSPVQKLPDKRA